VDIGKFYQTIAYGTDVEIAKDSKEACWQAYRLSTQDNMSYFVMPYNLYFLEGEKTTAYEICEQLGWNLPDKIIVPMGSGGHLSMIWKGIKELYEMGFIKQKTAEIVGTQAQGCSPIVAALQRGDDRIIPANTISTIAIDICVEDPPCGSLAIQAIRESGGTAVSLPDREIVLAVSLLAKLEGIFAEPAAATTIAGLKRLVDEGKIDPSEKIVCLITGMGLKYPEVTKSLIKGSKKLENLLKQVEKRKHVTTLGKTKLLILRIISKKESYGYEIWKALKVLEVKVKIPSVYQHLTELEDRNLIIRSRSERVLRKPERQYYKLTERGRVFLMQLEKFEI
jgi:threonine synthase